MELEPVMKLEKPVLLRQIKAEPLLADLPLLRQSRLSVSPVPDAHWRHIMQMAGWPA